MSRIPMLWLVLFELLLSPMVCMGQLSNEHSILKDWSEVYVEIEDETQELTAGSASVLDSVTKGKILLKDGSQVYGEIVDMIEGLITVNTSFHEGGPIKIKWSEVTGIESQDVMTFVLSNGTTLQGQSAMIQPGTLGVQTDLKKEAILIPIASVQGVNPPDLKTFAYTGNLNFGASKATGNTNVQNYTFLGEFGARSERLRLSLLGRYVYGENDNTVTARHAFGTLKLDYFVTKRFFIDSGALFEQDTFQDLNFRTAAFAGPGYQFIDKKDFSSPYLSNMQLSGEIGLGYFYEDFKFMGDQKNMTGRWAVHFNWPILTALTLFHQHQGYPSLEKRSDYYITSQQGLRWTLINNFISTFQMNWRYDNNPAPGTSNSDILYLLTLGYIFKS